MNLKADWTKQKIRFRNLCQVCRKQEDKCGEEKEGKSRKAPKRNRGHSKNVNTHVFGVPESKGEKNGVEETPTRIFQN